MPVIVMSTHLPVCNNEFYLDLKKTIKISSLQFFCVWYALNVGIKYLYPHREGSDNFYQEKIFFLPTKTNIFGHKTYLSLIMKPQPGKYKIAY